MRKYLFPALALGFFLISFVTLINSKPEHRNKRVYELIKPYMPYKIEKKVSGLKIIDTTSGKKYEPKTSDFYHVLDNLEKDWGDRYLRVEGNRLIIVDDENRTIKTILLQNRDERAYIKEFFGK
jgi:hypothetical protein